MKINWSTRFHGILYSFGRLNSDFISFSLENVYSVQIMTCFLLPKGLSTQVKISKSKPMCEQRDKLSSQLTQVSGEAEISFDLAIKSISID